MENKNNEAAQELEIFRDMVKRALQQEIQPHHGTWEKEGFLPRSMWNTLGNAGLLCVDLPVELGGSGVNFRFSQVILEEVSRLGYIGLSGSLAIHSDIVAQYILHIGTEDQQKDWLPRMATGEVVTAIAMTEPGAGSDLQGMRTTAVKDGDGYILNGSKTFITNGINADMVVVAAKTDPKAGGKGISLLLVDAHLPGFQKGKLLEKIGQHAGDTAELFFEDLRVPANALLGQENHGFFYLMQELPRERLAIGSSAVAAAEGALAWTVDYVTTRKAFGQPISQFQNTRFKLAELKTEIEINKAFLNQCIEKYEAGTMDVATAAMVKLSTTEMQCKVVDECLQLFGGYGYMSEYPIARAFVDARVQKIYAGTSEIMKEVIARDILGR
ncbi:MAG: acyl-CoA dehydrogenase family protein [Hahellaceae bacterium]|nr:acyl-CoA dehydrogenase family protein [Hahellaceae bacterium]